LLLPQPQRLSPFQFWDFRWQAQRSRGWSRDIPRWCPPSLGNLAHFLLGLAFFFYPSVDHSFCSLVVLSVSEPPPLYIFPGSHTDWVIPPSSPWKFHWPPPSPPEVESAPWSPPTFGIKIPPRPVSPPPCPPFDDDRFCYLGLFATLPFSFRIPPFSILSLPLSPVSSNGKSLRLVIFSPPFPFPSSPFARFLALFYA